MKASILYFLLLLAPAWAEYYVVELDDLALEVDAEKLEELKTYKKWYNNNPRYEAVQLRVPLDVTSYVAPSADFDVFSRENNNQDELLFEHQVAFDVEKGVEIKGVLDVKRDEGSYWSSYHFKLDTKKLTPVKKEEFDRVRTKAAEVAVSVESSGTGWFERYITKDIPELYKENDFMDLSFTSDLRVEAESFWGEIPNLSDIDRNIPIGELETPERQVEGLDEEFKAQDIQLSVAEKYIPFDQLVMFFKNKETVSKGILDIKNITRDFFQNQTNSQNLEQVFQHYEEQIGVSVEQLAKQESIKSAAITCGDQFLMNGTDIAIVLESDTAKSLYLKLISLRKQEGLETKEADWAQNVAISENDNLYSYIAYSGNIVILSNSIQQLKRIRQVHQGKLTSLAANKQYLYFRKNPSSEKNVGGIFITFEATVRLAHADLKIAQYRRMKALAVFQRCLYRHLAGENWQDISGIDRLGEVKLVDGVLRSSTLHQGLLLKPLSQWRVTSVTEKESKLYNDWVKNEKFYVSNSGGLVFEYREEGLELKAVFPNNENMEDVMMILNFLEPFQTSAKTVNVPNSNILNLSFDLNEGGIQELNNLIGDELNFEWSTGSVNIFMQHTPVSELLKYQRLSERFYDQVEKNFMHLGLGLRVERKKDVDIKPALETLRTFFVASGGKIIKSKHKEVPYLKFLNVPEFFFPSSSITEFFIAYTDDAVILCADEGVMFESITGELELNKEKLLEVKESPFLIQGDLKSIHAIYDANFRRSLSVKAIPTLNDMVRQLSKDQKEKLIEGSSMIFYCPGGKGYRWNEKKMSMESVVYGVLHEKKLVDAHYTNRYKKFKTSYAMGDEILDVRVLLKPEGSRFSLERVVEQGTGELIKTNDFVKTTPGVKYTYDAILTDFSNEIHTGEESYEILSFKDGKVEELHHLLSLDRGIEKKQERRSYTVGEGYFLNSIKYSDDSKLSYLDKGWRCFPNEMKVGYREYQKYIYTFDRSEAKSENLSYVKLHFVNQSDVRTKAGVIPDCYYLESTYYTINYGHLNVTTENLWVHPELGSVKYDLDYGLVKRKGELKDIIFPGDEE